MLKIGGLPSKFLLPDKTPTHTKLLALTASMRAGWAPEVERLEFSTHLAHP